MAIDIGIEQLLTFQEAAKLLPKRPHLSTLHRWRMRGVRGVRLETCLIGGIRYTSKEALQQFVDETTAVDTRAGSVVLDPRLHPHNKAVDRRQRCASDILNQRYNRILWMS